jgi:hypothetical protein
MVNRKFGHHQVKDSVDWCGPQGSMAALLDWSIAQANLSVVGDALDLFLQ